MSELELMCLSVAKDYRKNYIEEVIESINAGLRSALEENLDVFEYGFTQPGLAEYISFQYQEEGYEVKVVPPCVLRAKHWLTFNLNQLNP